MIPIKPKAILLLITYSCILLGVCFWGVSWLLNEVGKKTRIKFFGVTAAVIGESSVALISVAVMTGIFSLFKF